MINLVLRPVCLVRSSWESLEKEPCKKCSYHVGLDIGLYLLFLGVNPKWKCLDKGLVVPDTSQRMVGLLDKKSPGRRWQEGEEGEGGEGGEMD